jgi:hypothetical protein
MKLSTMLCGQPRVNTEVDEQALVVLSTTLAGALLVPIRFKAFAHGIITSANACGPAVNNAVKCSGKEEIVDKRPDATKRQPLNVLNETMRSRILQKRTGAIAGRRGSGTREYQRYHDAAPKHVFCVALFTPGSLGTKGRGNYLKIAI